MKVNLKVSIRDPQGEEIHEKFKLLMDEDGKVLRNANGDPYLMLDGEGKNVPTDLPVTYAMLILRYTDQHLFNNPKKANPEDQLSASDRYALGAVCNKICASAKVIDISNDERDLIKKVTGLYCQSNRILAQIFDLVDPPNDKSNA